MGDFYNTLKSVGSVGDYTRLQEEFDLKKAQAEQAAQLNALQGQKLQREMNTPDLESLAKQSLYAYHQGQPLSPEGKAALQTLAALEGNKTSYKADEFGDVKAYTEANPYAQFLDASTTPSFGGDPMAASQNAIMQRQSEIGSNPYQSDFTPVNLTQYDIEQQLQGTPVASQGANVPQQKNQLTDMAFDPQYSPQLDPEISRTTWGRKEGYNDAIARRKALFEAQLKQSMEKDTPYSDIGKMKKDEDRGLVPVGSTKALTEKARQPTVEEKRATDLAQEGLNALKDYEKALFKNGQINRAAIITGDFSIEGRDLIQPLRTAIVNNIYLKTGAAATPGEIESQMAQYKPNVFDTEPQIRRKLDSLKSFLKTKAPDFNPTGFRENQQNNQAEDPIDAELRRRGVL